MVGVEGGGQRVTQLYYAQEKLRLIDLQEKIAHKEKMKKLQKQKNRAKILCVIIVALLIVVLILIYYFVIKHDDDESGGNFLSLTHMVNVGN